MPGTAAAVAAATIVLGARTTNRPNIWNDNFDAVFAIEATGHLYNNTTESEAGTGFFVSDDGLALTANHVVLNSKDNYRSIDVSVRVPGSASAVPAEILDMDAKNDVALLRVTGVQLPRRVTLGTPSHSQIGGDIDVIGYPLTLGESIVAGSISAKPKANAWQMTAPVNPGTSGGPVFDDDDGTVIGLVTSGVTKVTQPDGSYYWVEGIKYFVPLDAYALPATVSIPDFTQTQTFPPPPPPPPLPGQNRQSQPITESVSRQNREHRGAPQEFTLGYHVSFEKTDHPVLFAPHARQYSADFQAEPGYRLTQIVGVSAISVNHASAPDLSLSPDGKTLTVRVTLTSGPAFDQYRAWYDATIVTRQQRDR